MLFHARLRDKPRPPALTTGILPLEPSLSRLMPEIRKLKVMPNALSLLVFVWARSLECPGTISYHSNSAPDFMTSARLQFPTQSLKKPLRSQKTNGPRCEFIPPRARRWSDLWDCQKPPH